MTLCLLISDTHDCHYAEDDSISEIVLCCVKRLLLSVLQTFDEAKGGGDSDSNGDSDSEISFAADSSSVERRASPRPRNSKPVCFSISMSCSAWPGLTLQE
jgi:hypothetical protein